MGGLPLAFHEGRAMDNQQYEELKASGRLPSPSGVALAIIELLRQDDYRIDEVTHLVQSDPAIAGCILKFANIPAFNHGRSFVSLDKAVFALGAFRVRDLVLGFSLIQSSSNVSCGDFDLDQFWSRSLAAAIANQQLAGYVKIAAEENFTLGLLSGVGELSMATLFPDSYAGLVDQASSVGELLSMERGHFDIDHRELCAAILTEWGLPEVFVRVVYFHEQMEMVEFMEGSRFQLLTLSLHFARRLAELCLAKEHQRWEMLSKLVTVGARLGIGSDDLSQLADRIVSAWREWGETLKIRTRNLPPFAEMLASAPPVFHEESSGVAGSERTSSRPRILLIGSDGDGAAGVKPLLDDSEWDAVTADSKDGLPVLSGPAQIVVADLDVPQQDVIALCLHIRESAPESYIIVVAPSGEVPALSRALESGIDDFLIKPVNANALEMRLRNARRMLVLREEIRRERRGFMTSSDSWAKGHRRLLQTAMTDPLTQLPNRLHGEDFLSLEWTSAHHSGRPLGCLMLDIDHFKRINDRYGHGIGDAVLCQIVNLIHGSLRSEDLAFRYGGEEFAVICPGASLQTALQIGERIRHAVESASFAQIDNIITVSIGGAVAHNGHQGYKDLLRDADQALYRAKHAGRNRVETFTLGQAG